MCFSIWSGALSRMKTRLSNNLRTIWARSYVRIVGANRELSWVFFEIFLPLLNVSAYVFVYRALNAPPEYEGFVIIGGSMLACWLNVLWNMASQFYWEKEMGHRSQLDPPCNLLCVCHSQDPFLLRSSWCSFTRSS